MLKRPEAEERLKYRRSIPGAVDRPILILLVRKLGTQARSGIPPRQGGLAACWFPAPLQ